MASWYKRHSQYTFAETPAEAWILHRFLKPLSYSGFPVATEGWTE
jgi:hypothetical protein